MSSDTERSESPTPTRTACRLRLRLRAPASPGFSLLEVTFAVALLAVVLGITAQALVSYQVAIDAQHRRNAGAQACASVLGDIRQFRDQNPVDDPDEFPGNLMQRFPQDATFVRNGDAWSLAAGAPPEDEPRVQVQYEQPLSNPQSIRVIYIWRDLRGRPLQVEAATLLTDR